MLNFNTKTQPTLEFTVRLLTATGGHCFGAQPCQAVVGVGVN